LLDAARRRERVLAYREAFTDGERLVLRYDALVTNDVDEPIERTRRWASVALPDLREARAVGDVPVEWLASDHALARRTHGVPVPMSAAAEPSPPAPFLDVRREDGRDVAVAFHPADGPDGSVVFYSGSLTRSRTAPWVYPLVPFAAAVDLVSNPVLLFLAPIVIVLGE
jgi:hypothetical protein